MKRMLRQFATSETGSIMVDWVVMTASIVGLAMVVMLSVGGGVEELAENTSDKVTAYAYE